MSGFKGKDFGRRMQKDKLFDLIETDISLKLEESIARENVVVENLRENFDLNVRFNNFKIMLVSLKQKNSIMFQQVKSVKMLSILNLTNSLTFSDLSSKFIGGSFLIEFPLLSFQDWPMVEFISTGLEVLKSLMPLRKII